MENTFKVSKASGFVNVGLSIAVLATMITLIVNRQIWALAIVPFWLLHLGGFLILQPNRAAVLLLFGAYKGTIKQNGFFWMNPFIAKKKISLRANNLDSKPIKVNDKLGNPIMIGGVLVWRVKDTYKAYFDVENYMDFVHIQTDAAIRKLAGAYPYDSFDDHEADICLRSDLEEVNSVLETEILFPFNHAPPFLKAW